MGIHLLHSQRPTTKYREYVVSDPVSEWQYNCQFIINIIGQEFMPCGKEWACFDLQRDGYRMKQSNSGGSPHTLGSWYMQSLVYFKEIIHLIRPLIHIFVQQNIFEFLNFININSYLMFQRTIQIRFLQESSTEICIQLMVARNCIVIVVIVGRTGNLHLL